MAVTAQFNEFHTSTINKNSRNFFTRLVTRIFLNCEARAIHRLEIEAGHLLSTDQLRQIKAEFAARKARVQI